MKINLFYILIILFVGIFIRFYQLGHIPNGLTVDEADMAYNTYSILKTGTDIYGKHLPLFFQSLDDYKPGLVHYSTIPALFLFGLNEFATRITAFIFGILTLPLLFIVTKMLYPKIKYFPYIAIAQFAFAPWHIALSRAMVWYIELIFLYLLFFSAFLLSQKKLKDPVKATLLIFSTVPLALTLYAYYAAIIYLPFILITIILIYKGFFKNNLKISLTAITVLAVLCLPAFQHYIGQNSRTRLNAISVLTPDITIPVSITETEKDKHEGIPFYQLIHNRRLVYASALLDNYFDYFNIDYLFVTSKNVRYFYTNYVGLFHLIELPFFIYGLLLMLKRKQKSDILILSLLIIGPIPASLTLGSPFPHRALLTILSIQLISVVGLSSLITTVFKKSNMHFSKTLFINKSERKFISRPWQLKKLYFRPLVYFLTLFYVLSVGFFSHQYFLHSKHEFTTENDNGAWFSTVRDVIPRVNQQKLKYDKVVFTWAQGKLVPPIYYLFYNQIDPQIIQKKALLWTKEPPSYRQIYYQIDNIEFRPINWDLDKSFNKTLLIGYPNEFPKNVENIIDKSYASDGQTHFIFVANP